MSSSSIAWLVTIGVLLAIMLVGVICSKLGTWWETRQNRKHRR